MASLIGLVAAIALVGLAVAGANAVFRVHVTEWYNRLRERSPLWAKILKITAIFTIGGTVVAGAVLGPIVLDLVWGDDDPKLTAEYRFDVERRPNEVEPVVDGGRPVVCATNDSGSVRSNRVGALVCVAIAPAGAPFIDGSNIGPYGFVLDPCLPIDERRVACVEPEAERGFSTRVFSLQRDAAPVGTTVKRPAADAWPWGIRLESGEFCLWELIDEGEARINTSAATPTYACPGAFYFVTVDLVAGPEGAVLTTDGVLAGGPETEPEIWGHAVELRRDAPHDWTVLVAGPGESTYSRVRVTEIWT